MNNSNFKFCIEKILKPYVQTIYFDFSAIF